MMQRSSIISRQNTILAFSLLAVVFGPCVRAYAGDLFVKPTAEELAMTALPGYPGAAAVVLYREEITRDDMHVVQHYDRIKILTEEGKKYANVELRFSSAREMEMDMSDDTMVGDIVGRTIHADGKIIPFTGKPYLKVVEKEHDVDFQSVDLHKIRLDEVKFEEKVFTLPDVEVGSIIEYRYATRYNDHSFEPPDWYIQGDLYLKAAHYTWYPTTEDLIDGETGAQINTITWFPILPTGAEIVHRTVPAAGRLGRDQLVYDLVVKDVPPMPKEEYMPPIASFSYRVLYNFSEYRSSQDFWASAGKHWSKTANNFSNPNADLTGATQGIIAGANTQDEKLRKIYAAVMALENTNFTREHGKREDKASGEGAVNKAADVLTHKRGSSTQLTELFVGMARAAGMKAYLMLVPDRAERLFTPMWMNMQQFDDTIAIVNVDGKDQFFDPGSRYCPYGHVAWQHSGVQGIRQTDAGTGFVQAPGDSYADNKTSRVANLYMDDKGEIRGKIDLTFAGAPALSWRQTSLRGDEESLKHGLRTHLEDMLPKSLEVKVSEIKGLDDYEKPLTVSYEVKGTLGTATGKRLLMPADLFLAGSTATFPHEKRELAVYFHYPQTIQDALRVNFPEQFVVEGVPSEAKFGMPKLALYSMSVVADPKNFTTRRSYMFAGIIVPPTDYPELRTFYSQFESKDQESVVLKVVPASATTAPTAN